VTARAVLDRAMSEAEWQRTVTDYATLRGWRWFHDNDSRRNKAGLPDLLLVRDRRLVFAELKREKVVGLRREQEAWIRALNVTPAEVYVWRPSSWNDVERILR
jgi:hypothetical protein